MEAEADASAEPYSDHGQNAFHSLVQDPNATFSEQFLLGANKGLLKETLMSDENSAFGSGTSRHEKIWNALLRTARNPRVSNTHLTAACNAICGFLNAARASKSPDLRRFAQAGHTWLAAFEIYLHRYGDAKSKVMSQLLSSLSNALSKNPDLETADSLKGTVTNALLKTILHVEPVPTLKPSIIAFDYMLRKRIFVVDHLLEFTRLFLESCDDSLKKTETASNGPSKGHRPSEQGPSDKTGSISVTVPMPLYALIAALVATCFQADVASIAAQSLSTLLDVLGQDPAKSAEPGMLQELCALIFIRSIHTQPSSLQDFRNHVFPVVFKNNRHCFLAFVQRTLQGDGPSLYSVSELNLRLLFSAFEIGMELGLLNPNLLQSQPNINDVGKLGFGMVHRHLFHVSPSLRLSATSLIINSSQVTAPFTSEQLSALRDSIFFSHADPDPEIRSGIISLERRLIIRIRGVISALGKKGSPATGQLTKAISPVNFDRSIELCRAHQSFLKWYIDALINDLCPAINYQKHITALKAIQMLLQSGLDKNVSTECLSKLGRDQVKWAVHIPICSKVMFRSLLDLLLDPFDDVRSAALEILKLFPVTSSDDKRTEYGLELGQLRQALFRAEDLVCRTGRADHADGVAQLQYLLFHVLANFPGGNQWHLRSMVDRVAALVEASTIVARSEPSRRGSTVHSYLSTLRCLISYPSFHSLASVCWREFHERCMNICSKIWIEARDNLCIDSPEGQTDDVDYDLGLGPKDLLSASWRALREASLLLNAMISTSPDAAPPDDSGLTKKDFVAIGELCFTQLAELRHRGAFSTVSQTFAACCNRCEQSQDSDVRELLSTWLGAALLIIDRNASKLTRRSAGIPAIISGIVSANPGGHVFLSAMDSLSRLCQVHALNCLKEIVTNTRLGASTEPFIPLLVDISVRSIESQRWAIRNCGLMLLRALIGRMCQSSNLSSRSEDMGDELAKISYNKFPSLEGVVQRLLEEEAGSQLPNDSDQLQATQKIFVALELVRRRLSSADIGPQFLELLLKRTSSANWSIREQAAKAYASQIRKADYSLVVCGLLSREWPSINALHGALLSARYIVKRLLSAQAVQGIVHLHRTANDTAGELISILEVADVHKYPILGRNCPHTAAVFWDIVCELVEHLIKNYEPGGYIPTLKRSCQFPHEMAWAENAYATSTTPLLFLGFTMPLKKPTISRESSSYMRFLCLQLIIDHFPNGNSDRVERMMWHELHEAITSLQSFAPKALSGFEMIFEPPWVMYRSRIDLYESLVWSEGSEEYKIVVLRNIADLFQRMDDSMLDGRSILGHTGALADIFCWVDYPDWNSPANKLAGRDLYEVTLCLEGTFTTMRFFQFYELENDPEDTNKRLEELVTLRILHWVKKLRLAGNEQNEVSTRHNAAQSIEAFKYALRSRGTSARVSDPLLAVYLALYDTLNDDEEAIRNIGAKVASWVLGGPDVPTSKTNRGEDNLVSLLPLAASLRMSEFFVAEFEESTSLFREALGRLAGQRETINSSASIGKLQPVDIQLRKATEENNDLFAEEKQNLFIDEPREIVIWSTVLSGLSLRNVTDSADNGLIPGFLEWSLKGIQCLTQAARDRSTDGPLGWTSNPDVFVLGLRVIYGAKVVLQWATENSIPHKGPLVTGLKEFVKQGQDVQLHDRWLETARGVLKTDSGS